MNCSSDASSPLPIETINRLIAAALDARSHAYAPYSHFAVGAALLSSDQRIFPGCNVENASFGATICAERSAVCAAVSAGCSDFAAIAIVYAADDYAVPCGICRQVLSEFNPDLPVICATLARTFVITSLRELFPNSFRKDALK